MAPAQSEEPQLPGMPQPWRPWVDEKAQEFLEGGCEPHAPSLADMAWNEIPAPLMVACSKTAVADEVRSYLRRKNKVAVPRSDGTKHYLTYEQMTIPDIVTAVSGKLNLAGNTKARAVEDAENWKLVHPESELTVSDIVRMAEEQI